MKLPPPGHHAGSPPILLNRCRNRARSPSFCVNYGRVQRLASQVCHLSFQRFGSSFKASHSRFSGFQHCRTQKRGLAAFQRCDSPVGKLDVAVDALQTGACRLRFRRRLG